MRAVLSAAALFMAGAPSPGPTSDAILQAQPVVDRFYAAVVRCGGRHPTKPMINVEGTAGVIHFDGTNIVIYPWETMGQGIQAALTAQAQSGGVGSDGAGEYRAIFNELLLAHEMGHWVQQRGLIANRWQREYNANQMMVAFWREYPQGAATDRRLVEYLRFVPGTSNPMPPPAGESQERYFNEHYFELMRSPAYGWYQNISGRLAVDERPQPRFCDLVRRWTTTTD